MDTSSQPNLLRRTRGDLIASATLAAVAVVAVGGAWLTAPIRAVDHSPAPAPIPVVENLADVPTSVSESFRVTDVALPGVHRPVVVDGVVMASDGHTLKAYDDSGQQQYSYGRADREICSLAEAWGDVVITYKSGVGCGDVVSLTAATGEYSATRSALNDEKTVAVSSNDRVGTVGATRVELWRSDLVRTVEYGEVSAKQEPGLQPHEDCTITSALTRKELLAITEVCPDKPEVTMLRLQPTNPEESRKPEITASAEVPSPDARLVGIGQDSAAVYVPTKDPRIQSYDANGTLLSTADVSPAPALDGVEGVWAPATGDLPHNMTFFDGQRLYLLAPSDLSVSHVIEDVRGTGAAVGDRLLVPVDGGIAVVDWSTGQSERTIHVDRAGYTGDVHLEIAGGVIVEKRGDELVALKPN